MKVRERAPTTKKYTHTKEIPTGRDTRVRVRAKALLTKRDKHREKPTGRVILVRVWATALLKKGETDRGNTPPARTTRVRVRAKAPITMQTPPNPTRD